MSKNNIVGKSRYVAGYKDIVWAALIGGEEIAKIKESNQNLPTFKGNCPDDFRGMYLSEGHTKSVWIDLRAVAREECFEKETPYLLIREMIPTKSL